MSATRRQFLVYAGIGTYAALRQSGVGVASEFPVPRRRGRAPGFRPVSPSAADELRVPEGFRADVVAAWKDPLGVSGPHGPEQFGFNADFIAFFPMDEGRRRPVGTGKASEEGLLWVNHEYPNPLFVSGYAGKGVKTEAQILAEKLCVGGSVIHVKREQGRWRHVPGSRHTRRFTAAYPSFTVSGPVGKVYPQISGTLANCSGGRTPWGTALSCEENFQDFNTVVAPGYRWSDVPALQLDEKQYGWVIEVDPFGELPPMKHSALGRFSHENTAMRLGPTGRLAVYMGDDAQDQYLYKYVSAGRYQEGDSRAEQRRLLSEGTLYVADFARGVWIPLDFSRNKELQAAGFKDQADVLIRAREASAAVKATPIDRPEDCEVHPLDGSLYVALTNNAKHGNLYGQIVRLVEDGDNPEAESFRYEIFLAGGPQSGLACPDNLLFDKKGNLWVACDISSRSVGRGAYKGFGNNGLYVVPTTGASAGDAFQFASGPVEAELTGPWFTENEDTLFLSVQHPGEESLSTDTPSSRWPDGGASIPRPGVVAITGFK